jgi:beta-glucan synthesis-associated protein KRE6
VYNDEITSMNVYRGGPYQEAFSAVSWLNTDWYDGNAYQKYGIEYVPGATGDLSWFVGDEYTWKIDHRSLRPNGNVGQRVIPEEPMSIVVNFGISNTFAQVFLANLAELLPATMRIDYIRVYQDPSQVSVTCDPDGYETTEYINQHPDAYNVSNFLSAIGHLLTAWQNPNVTFWKDAGYSWPSNTLVDNCSS